MFKHKTVIVFLVLAGVGFTAVAASAEEGCPGARDGDKTGGLRFPNVEADWMAKYPTSTLSARMAALPDGRTCYVCHHPPIGNRGNCYRIDLAELINGGMSAADAIDTLDAEDSDGDGFTNGEEILMERAGEPGEIGYNPGLIGDTGTDPCGNDDTEVVTGVSETPPDPVPTVSQWGVAVMTLLLVTAGTLLLARRQTVRAV